MPHTTTSKFPRIDGENSCGTSKKGSLSYELVVAFFVVIVGISSLILSQKSQFRIEHFSRRFFSFSFGHWVRTECSSSMIHVCDRKKWIFQRLLPKTAEMRRNFELHPPAPYNSGAREKYIPDYQITSREILKKWWRTTKCDHKPILWVEIPWGLWRGIFLARQAWVLIKLWPWKTYGQEKVGLHLFSHQFR